MRLEVLVVVLFASACSADTAPTAPDPGLPAGGASPELSPRVGGCAIFPADNAWNRDVSGEALDPASDALIAALSPNAALHLDLGTTEEHYGIPYTVVPASQPRYDQSISIT